MNTLSGRVILIADDNIHALDRRQTGWVVLPCTTDKTEPQQWCALLAL